MTGEAGRYNTVFWLKSALAVYLYLWTNKIFVINRWNLLFQFSTLINVFSLSARFENYLYKISLSTDVLNFMFELLACPIEFLIIHLHLLINLSLIINDLKLAQTGKFQIIHKRNWLVRLFDPPFLILHLSLLLRIFSAVQ